MPPAKKPTAPTPIEVLKHPADTRKNIPTAELRDFVADEEHTPVTVRYPRNPDSQIQHDIFRHFARHCGALSLSKGCTGLWWAICRI